MRNAKVFRRAIANVCLVTYVFKSALVPCSLAYSVHSYIGKQYETRALFNWDKLKITLSRKALVHCKLSLLIFQLSYQMFTLSQVFVTFLA
jgi:hypothetical protein